MYTGYKKLQLTQEQLSGLYTNHILEGCEYDFKKNEYLIALNDDLAPVDYFQWNGREFHSLVYPTISNQIVGTVKPMEEYQYCALSLLQNRDIPVKLIRGVYGSGKLFATV